ncbi:hypothetical protein [Roseibacillus ishigakijimensis]|uniref:Uncharacterized protein n=1 Tax=Roseibacillus ishigakijimensis TaxID=454146 RepID=A0A934RQ24_9BACT|nr:hypothetical protein [Roseibacillus ishigakijimensis]MBK1835394.1 hypothetical protein [Roseibacillus ishigakijimensis]
MKASRLGRSRRKEPCPLCFAWLRGDDSLVRFWVAVLLAGAVTVFAVRFVDLGVPVSLAVDRPELGRAQLIVLDESSDPALRRLLQDSALPDLGQEEEGPFLEEVLGPLGLAENTMLPPLVLPAPVLAEEAEWPEENGELILPPLPELQENWWRGPGGGERTWQMRVVLPQAEGEREILLPWPGAAGARDSRWVLSFDEEGAVAFASAVAGVGEKREREMRRALQLLALREDLAPGAGTVFARIVIEEKGGE